MQATQYRYNLDRGSKKFKCPDCGNKSLVLYRDSETGNYLPDHVGRCDRENRCAYHFTAGQYLKEAKPNSKENTGFSRPFLWTPKTLFLNRNATFRKEPPIQEPAQLISFLSMEMVDASMGIKQAGKQDETDALLQSDFAHYTGNTFGFYVSHYILARHHVGRSKLGDGSACIFWRVDIENRVRTGKIMWYDPHTGKRRKDINPTWVHALKKPDGSPMFPDFNLSLCFFGEHLMSTEPEKPVCLVESEKTALICSFYMPQFIWIASGGASGCKWRDYDVFKVFKNRTVVLYPDYGLFSKKTGRTCFEEWSDRAENIRKAIPCKISVSNILEKLLPEHYRQQDFDLADLLPTTDGGYKMEI